MASAAPTASSTKETTKYARLCRLLVDVGTQALRDTFDAIHPPANLHTVLAGNKTTLQSLRKRKIINPTQWGKLFPAIPNSVSSRDFDITLLMVLLRNICGLPSPVTGWDTLPAATDVSREADIARVKYFRNTVFAHAEHASIDDATFNTYWQDIRDTLVRLGGVQYRAAIDNLETECMDPEIEDHYKELLSQWKKDEDNVKETLSEIMKKLDDLKAENDSTKKAMIGEGKCLGLKEMTHGPVMCKEKYHENEAVEYYCQECRVCICHKCSVMIHNQHDKKDIQQAAEGRKTEMTNVFEKAKATVVAVEAKITQQVELMKKSEEEISAAEKKATETVEEVIRVAREHEMAIKKELAEIREAEQKDHETKMEMFQVFATRLKSSVECGEGIVERNVGAEILQSGHAVLCHCEELLNTQEIKIHHPQHVTYLLNKESMNAVRCLVPGQVVASHTDPSQSVTKGNGLNKTELGAETTFTITTRDSEGNQHYGKEDQVIVNVCTPKREDKTKINSEDRKDGIYTVRYKPKTVGLHDIVVDVNGTPLSGSPWSVQVTPHQYKALSPLYSFKRGQRQEEFSTPQSIATSEKTGNIAVADYNNKRVLLFDSEWKYLRTIGNKEAGSKRISEPTSVAFTASGDVIVTHGEFPQPRNLSVFGDDGHFIRHICENLIKRPSSVFVRSDDCMVVCDLGDKTVKVLSPDGTRLLQCFSAPSSDEGPWFAIYHEEKFFVCYYRAHCVKVFDKEGEFLYDIGREGSGDGQFKFAAGLTVDKFNNLVVCDSHNKRLQIFRLNGDFMNSVQDSVNDRMDDPWCVAVTKNGDLLVCDRDKHCIRIFQ